MQRFFELGVKSGMSDTKFTQMIRQVRRLVLDKYSVDVSVNGKTTDPDDSESYLSSGNE